MKFEIISGIKKFPNIDTWIRYLEACELHGWKASVRGAAAYEKMEPYRSLWTKRKSA